MNIRTLQERMMESVTRMREIQDQAAEENRDLTAEENQAFDLAEADVSKLEKQIQREAKLQQLEQRKVEEAAAGGELAAPERRQPEAPPAIQRAGRSSGELLDASFRAWVRGAIFHQALSDDEREACRRTGIDPRADAINLKMLNNADLERLHREERQLSTPKGVTPASGELIPIGFMRRLEADLFWYGGMTSVAEVWRTNEGNSVFWPTVSDTSGTEPNQSPIKGRMIAEGAEVTDFTYASYGEVEFKAYKASSDAVLINQELLEDAAWDVGALTASQLGERIGRLVNEKCTKGGGTTEPTGIVTGAHTVSQGATVGSDDMIDLAHEVDPAYRNNAQYMFNDKTLASLRKLQTGDGWYIWQPQPLAGLQQGVTGTIYGFPYTINNEMDDIAATGGAKPIIFGDLRRFKIRMVRNLRLRVFTEKFGMSDQTGYLAFFRFDSNHVNKMAYRVMEQPA